MGLYSSCSNLNPAMLQDGRVFLPHIDQILCQSHCIRVACDCDGPVCSATFTLFTIRDANHGPANLPGKRKIINFMTLNMTAGEL
jgi:hypothetical protein